jgi:hypothetical protein
MLENTIDSLFDSPVNETAENEAYIHEYIKLLKKTNENLAELLQVKEKVTEKIIGAFNHNKDGQTTYEFQAWKVEIKTPCIYSLDKKKYENGKVSLPTGFNPIKESISYNIDKKLCDKFMSSAPKKVRETLFDLIEIKPGKASVTIKENI